MIAYLTNGEENSMINNRILNLVKYLIELAQILLDQSNKKSTLPPV